MLVIHTRRECLAGKASTGNHDASADDYNLSLYDEQWTAGASMRVTACYSRLLYDERLYDCAFVWALRWLVTPVECTCSNLTGA